MIKRNPAPTARTGLIDWVTLRARLASADVAQVRQLSLEAQQEILLRRAQSLALEERPARSSSELVEVLEFSLAHENYAVPSAAVAEVTPLREYAALPFVPRFVLGACYLRGRMLTVFDLRRFFGLPDPGLTDLNRVIVLSHAEFEIGVLADAVHGVASFALDELSAPLPAGGGLRAEYCRGISTSGSILLDLTRLISKGGLFAALAPA